jgi:plastocyanin domain-containing protein
MVITVIVKGSGYSPSAIILQKGMKAIIKFKANEPASCNTAIAADRASAGASGGTSGCCGR